jgi:hypothetical protein
MRAAGPTTIHSSCGSVEGPTTTPPMNQFKPNPLRVGHAGNGRAFQELIDKGIRAIVHPRGQASCGP